jgi:hypothetical protein
MSSPDSGELFFCPVKSGQHFHFVGFSTHNEIFFTLTLIFILQNVPSKGAAGPISENKRSAYRFHAPMHLSGNSIVI